MLFDPTSRRVVGTSISNEIAIGDRHFDPCYLYSWDERCLVAAVTEYQRVSWHDPIDRALHHLQRVQDFSDLTWRSEQNVPIAEGPVLPGSVASSSG